VVSSWTALSTSRVVFKEGWRLILMEIKFLKNVGQFSLPGVRDGLVNLTGKVPSSRGVVRGDIV